MHFVCNKGSNWVNGHICLDMDFSFNLETFLLAGFQRLFNTRMYGMGS